MVVQTSTAATADVATRRKTPPSTKPHPFNRINSHDTVATSVQVARDAEAMALEMQQIVAGYAPPSPPSSALQVSSRTRKKPKKTQKKTQKQMKITTVQHSSLTIGKYKTKQKNPVSANAASNTGPKRKKKKGEFIGRKLNHKSLSKSYSSIDSSSSSSCSSNDDYTSDGDDRTNDDETCTSRSGSSGSSSSDDNTSHYDCVDSSLGPSSSSSSYDGRTDSYNLSEFGSTSFTTGAFSQSYTNHTRFNDSQSYTNHTRGDEYTNHTRDSCYTSASSQRGGSGSFYTTEGEDSDNSSSSGSCSSGSSRGHRSTDVEENAAEYDTDFHTQDSHDIENEDDDDDDDNHSQTVRAARSRNPGGLKIIAGTATTSTSRRGRSPMPRVKSTNSITVSVDEILSDEEEEFSRIRSPRRNIPLPMSKSTMSTYDDDDDANDADEDGYTTATTGDGTSYCTRDDTCTSYDDDDDSRFEEEGYYTTSYEDLHDDDTDTSRSFRNRKQQKHTQKHQSSMSDNDFDHRDPEDENNSITAAADPIIKCRTEEEIIHPPSRSTMHTDKTSTGKTMAATATATMSTSPRSTKLLGIMNTTFDSLDNEQKEFEQFVKEQDALERTEKERVRLLAEKRKKDLELALNGGKTKKKQETTTDDDSSIAAGNSVFSWIFGSGSVFSGSTTPAITVKSAPAAGTAEVAQPGFTSPDLSSNKNSKTTVAASSTSVPPKKIQQKDKNISTTTSAPLMKMETETLSTKASALAYESDAFDNVEDSDAFDSLDSTTVDDEDNGGGEDDNDNSINEMKQSSTNRTTGSADPIGSTGYISYEQDLMKNPTTIITKNQDIESYPNTSIENIVCGIEHFNHILDDSDDFSVGESDGGLRDDEYILSSKEVLSPCCGTPNDPSMHVRKFTFTKNTDTTDDRRECGGNVIVNTGSPTKRIQAENLEHYEISEIMHGKSSCKVQKESSTASIPPPTASSSTAEEERTHRQSCHIVEEDVDDEKHVNTEMIAEEPMDDSIISVTSLSVENCDKQQQRPSTGRESIGTNSAVNNDSRNMSSEPTYTIQTNSIVQDDASLPSKDKPDELMELVRNAFAVILSPDNNSTTATSSMLHSDNNIDYEESAKLPPRSPILPPISSENVLGVVYNFFSSKNEDPAFLLSSESKAFNEIENDDGSDNAIKCTGWNPNTQTSLTAQASTESISQTNTSIFLSKADTMSLTIATPASPSTSCFNEDGIPLDVSPKKIWKAFDSGFEAVPSVSKNVRNTSQVSSTKTSSPIVKTINGATTADIATNINHRNSRSKEPIINGSVKSPKPTHQVMMNQVEVKQQKQSDARRGVSLSARYRTQRHADFLSKRLKQRKESRSPLKRRISDGFLQKHKKEDRNTNHQPPDSSKSFVKRVATHARSIGLSVSTAFESSSSPSTGTTPTQLAGTIKYDKIISPVVSPTTKSRSSSKTPLSPSPDTSSAISSQKTNLSDIRSRIRQRRRTKIFPKRTASSVPPSKRSSNDQASSPSSPRRSSFSLSPTKKKKMIIQSYPIRTVPILESRDDSEVSHLNTDEFYDAVSFDDDKGGAMKAHNGIDCCTASKELLPEDQERDFPDISYKESMLSAVMSLD